MGQSTIDLVEQIWAWIYCLVTNTVESKFFTLEMDMIVGGVVRIGLFLAQIFYTDIYETESMSLYFNGSGWFIYQLYVLTIETKYIFFGISITQKRQLIYKIMDLLQSIYGIYFVLPDRGENGEQVITPVQAVLLSKNTILFFPQKTITQKSDYQRRKQLRKFDDLQFKGLNLIIHNFPLCHQFNNLIL